MSEPASPMESLDGTLDVDHLIMEVETRPPLWDKYSKSYSDRILKTRLWEEVCQNVIPKWDELSNDKKKKKGAEVQKKWKNLKDCFSRELTSQKKSVSGQSGKKKRKYLYFDQLSFLIAVNTPRDTSGSVKSMEECGTGAITDIQSDEENTPPKQDSRRSSYLRKTGAKAQKGNTDINEELLDILREKKEQNFDEDVSFAEMLIPMLRKLNQDQKLYAKMEILNAMDRAKRYVSVSQPVFPVSIASMHDAQPLYPKSTVVMQTVPQPIHPGHMLASPMYPNTRATYINAEPGTSSASNFVTPRNIVIHSNKTITKQENCNDYLERFANDLQSPESVNSLDSDDYYDVTLTSL